MSLTLTNYGHRLVQHLARDAAAYDAWDDDERELLMALWVDLQAPDEARSRYADLEARGLVQRAALDLDDEAVRTRYSRNPLEHVERLVFEYTTACAFACLHCRNGAVTPQTVSDLEPLAQAVDLLAAVGVRRFDFIGGEVIQFGDGWLELVRRIGRHEGSVIGVSTSGWFLGARDFAAAGQRYADHHELLVELRRAGLTHVIFSLDGPAELHDRWRQSAGLYRRVLDGFEDVRRAGMQPRLSVVLGPHVEEQRRVEWLCDLVDRIYDLPEDTGPPVKLSLLLRDDTNYVSNLITIGNAVQLGRPLLALDEVPVDLLRCKSFFRPHPSLRIRANGELALCPLADAGEGYGNVIKQGLLAVVNRMQEAPVYRLHAEERLHTALPLLDREVFGEVFGDLCSLRAVLTTLAREVAAGDVSPDDTAALRRINESVALRLGFLRERIDGGK